MLNISNETSQKIKNIMDVYFENMNYGAFVLSIHFDENKELKLHSSFGDMNDEVFKLFGKKITKYTNTFDSYRKPNKGKDEYIELNKKLYSLLDEYNCINTLLLVNYGCLSGCLIDIVKLDDINENISQIEEYLQNKNVLKDKNHNHEMLVTIDSSCKMAYVSIDGVVIKCGNFWDFHRTSPWKPPLFRGWRKRRIFKNISLINLIFKTI